MDFVTDQNNKPLYLADQLAGLPEYVKTASPIETDQLAALQPNAFGDPAVREYPIHTKAATWLSACYALGTGREDEALWGTLNKAAAFHGITEDLTALAGVFAEHNKAASAPVRAYALTVNFGDTGDLGVRNFYPIDNPYSICKSARDMVNDYAADRLRIEHFRPAAIELVKAARANFVDSIDIHPRVLAVGEERIPDFSSAEQVAELRKNAGVDDEGVVLYKEAAAGALAEPSAADKWLDLWLDLDATYNVKYSALQPSPYEAFYAGDTLSDIAKLASEMVLIEGALIPREALRAVPEDLIKRAFRKETADVLIAAVADAQTEPALASGAFEKLGSATSKHFLELVIAQN